MSLKEFGRFTSDAREYCITEPFAPPRMQINFLWNDRMISGVNQFGTGEGVFNNQTMLYNHPEGRVRLIRDGRRYFYLLDRETGAFYNTGLFPKSAPGAKLTTYVGLGYSRFVTEYSGIQCESTVMLHPDEPAEIWEFTIRNTGSTPRKLSLVPFVDWFLLGYPTFSSAYSYWRGLLRADCNAVVGCNSSDERPHQRYNGFVACDRPFTEWCGGSRDFLGPFGTIENPRSLIEGKMSGKEAWCEEPASAMMLDFELAPGAEETLAVSIGSWDTEEELRRLTKKTLDPAERRAAREALTRDKDAMVANLTIETPEKKIDRLVNVWSKQQIKLCTEFGRDGARGFRDTLQDAWGIVSLDPALTRRKILETLAHQHADGHGVRGWMPLQPHHYSDGPVWIVPAVTGYLKETGDYAFLDEKAPYLEGGEGTVLEHLLRGVRHLAGDLGVHGLVLAHEGDWNDSLNWMGRGGKGESVWTSMGLYYALNLTEELAKEILHDEALAAEMRAHAAKMDQAINSSGWDGEWYLAGYSDAGNKVGSAENREGKIYLNPQTWAVMTGLARGERKELCLKAIDTLLESDFGSLTLTPSYTGRDENVGRVTMLLPGMYENGTPYCHGTAFKIVADCCAGRAKEALQSYLKVLPDGVNPSIESGCEPYAFTNQYLGPANGRAGASISGWISGTAGWMFRAMTEYFLGVQPSYRGFHIRPTLPPEWKGAKIERLLRGKRYIIELTPGSVKVNGQHLEGDFISY